MKAPMIIAPLMICLTTTAHADSDRARKAWQPVSGTAIHYFSSAVVHDRQETRSGYVQRSTETVELKGDLNGRVLYHPLTVLDYSAGTLVNTGHQVFSGTVLGSEPVLIHDDEFRFEVDLASGATIGEAYLVDRIAGPRIRCQLRIIGTGMTPEGDGLAEYTGKCRIGQDRRPARDTD